MNPVQRRALRTAVVSAAALAFVATTSDARAYCRSTTCDPQTYDCPVDDNGCSRGGPPLSWRTLPLQYRFQRDGSSKLDMDLAREAARRAFDTWSEVRCKSGRTSLRFEEGPDITRDKPLKKKSQGSEPFGIYFRDETWPYASGDDALAITSQTFGMYSGYIEYADIEINTSQRQYAVGDEEPGIDLQAVFTHEIGHYIGLAHSNASDSIMVARYCQSADRCGKDVETARALAQDDIDAVCALYPPSGIAGVKYEEPSGCAATSAPGRDEKSAWPVVLAFGAVLIAAARARRTRG
ncbi:MAG: matrixin family metalloprotease [Deltaproteobacteria bacterium]|nr:matrixin family metalloprotease [Deltaproteobacteria bacterium]